MSGNGKRVLAASAATTSSTRAASSMALPSIQTKPSLNSEDWMTDQLAGGLVKTDETIRSEKNYSYQEKNFGVEDRIYSIDDEEIDEPPVPIPSTWRETEKLQKKSWIAEQIRSSAYGFIIGLFIVVPAMMLLTSFRDDRGPSWQSITDYAQKTSRDLGLDEYLAVLLRKEVQSSPAQSSPEEDMAKSDSNDKRIPLTAPNKTPVESETSTPGSSKAGNAVEQAARGKVNSTSVQHLEPSGHSPENVSVLASQKSLVSEAMKQAKKAITSGNLVAARKILAQQASLGDGSAVFSLAETYDPNVLAAWGTHGQEADAEKAKMFYAMALTQGVEKAKQRIQALK